VESCEKKKIRVCVQLSKMVKIEFYFNKMQIENTEINKIPNSIVKLNNFVKRDLLKKSKHIYFRCCSENASDDVRFIVNGKENYEISCYMQNENTFNISMPVLSLFYVKKKLDSISEEIYKNFSGKIKSKNLYYHVKMYLRASLYMYGSEGLIDYKKKAKEGTLTVKNIQNIQRVLRCYDNKLIKAFEEFCNS